MAFTFGDNADFAQNQALNMVLQVLGSDPSTPSLGQTYFNSGTNLIRSYNGATWNEYSAGGNTNLTFSRDATTVTIESDTGTNAILPVATGALAGILTAANWTKLDGIETSATADQTGAEIKSAYEAEANTNAYTDAEVTKLGHISVTQAVDLDQMETDIAALANGMVYKGNWDASLGTFPASADTGFFYTVSVAGTVDSVAFAIDDRLIAVTDSASTTVYAANWTKVDATDAVQSVNGNTGTVVLTTGDLTEDVDKNYVTDAQKTVIAGISGTNTGDEVTATTTIEGVAEIATQTEVNTGTEAGAKFVTPATLQSKLGVTGSLNSAVRYSATIGNGSLTTITVTHSIGRQFLNIDVYRTASPFDKVYPTIECDSTTVASLTFSVAPTSAEYTVVITG